MEFKPFPKIPRLNRDVIVTEKIDGTNALVAISEDGQTIRAGSRNRWITPEKDNFGFAAWVEENKDDLLQLGPGYHYGEWWGQGIQRGYGLDHRRFSLFNTTRWNKVRIRRPEEAVQQFPSCCHVVPELWVGEFPHLSVDEWLVWLNVNGSKAAPGFMNPEGIVIYHNASGQLFKVTCENDHKGKEYAVR